MNLPLRHLVFIRWLTDRNGVTIDGDPDVIASSPSSTFSEISGRISASRAAAEAEARQRVVQGSYPFSAVGYQVVTAELQETDTTQPVRFRTT